MNKTFERRKAQGLCPTCGQRPVTRFSKCLRCRINSYKSQETARKVLRIIRENAA